MTERQLAGRLKQYDSQEARSIVRLLLYDLFGFTLTDICLGKLEQLSADYRLKLENCIQRLEQGEPIQYVTGKTHFCGREFHVEHGVLIPRIETEILCEIIINNISTLRANKEIPIRILDVGTGSGCIATTLAKEIENSQVTAWDISNEALQIASNNSKKLGAKVTYEKTDILHIQEPQTSSAPQYDIIVSNPPYVCYAEAADMEKHVLEHEPHTALFVPDEEPLLFYQAITEYATKALKNGGRLYFEINPLYSEEMTKMMATYGFKDVNTHQDQFGKIRFVSASFT